MKTKKFKESGITLIALVITIIVLLILAGVTLSILLQTGIIENSQRAVNLYQSKAEDEVKQIDDLNIQIQTQFGILDNTEGEANQTITGDKKFAYNNPVIPVGFKTSNEGASWKSSDGETVDGWNSGLVIEDKDGNQFVWVPAQLPNEGIEGLAKYQKVFTAPTLLPNLQNNALQSLDDVKDASLPNGIDSEESQITTYGGFYIGRYEAGIPENIEKDVIDLEKFIDKNKFDNITGGNYTEDIMNYINEMHEKISEITDVENKPVSKKNKIPWLCISYDNAKKNAESMYIGENVQSGLLTGTMWDTTLSWLVESEALKEDEVDSTLWGNFTNSTIPGITEYSSDGGFGIIYKKTNPITKPDKGSKTKEYYWLLKTGNTEYTKRNNIYDLCGNMWEWTNETKSSCGICRSGSWCGGVGSNVSTTARCCWNDKEYIWSDLGYRVALYIK